MIHIHLFYLMLTLPLHNVATGLPATQNRYHSDSHEKDCLQHKGPHTRSVKQSKWTAQTDLRSALSLSYMYCVNLLISSQLSLRYSHVLGLL